MTSCGRCMFCAYSRKHCRCARSASSKHSVIVVKLDGRRRAADSKDTLAAAEGQATDGAPLLDTCGQHLQDACELAVLQSTNRFSWEPYACATRRTCCTRPDMRYEVRTRCHSVGCFTWHNIPTKLGMMTKAVNQVALWWPLPTHFSALTACARYQNLAQMLALPVLGCLKLPPGHLLLQRLCCCRQQVLHTWTGTANVALLHGAACALSSCAALAQGQGLHATPVLACSDPAQSFSISAPKNSYKCIIR